MQEHQFNTMADLNLLHNNEGLHRLISFLKSKGERRILKRREFFVRQGDSHAEIAYILRGSFKLFTSDYRGKEQILSFSFDHEFVACYLPPRYGCKALLSVQAMEESVLLVAPLQEVLSQIQIEQDGTVFVSDFIECLAFDLLRKNVSFRCETPEERYRQLIVRIPDILNRVSMKDIASYIGVTPETLSRMRSRMVLEEK